MSFDAERLRHWQVPTVHQTLTRKDTALYALTTGFGLDPMDRAVLPFVDPNHPDLRASPSMPLVLGYPGSWISHPELEVDMPRMLHLDQTIELIGPVPVEGEIEGRTEVIDVIDRGEGRGVLVPHERILTCDGTPFARLMQTVLLRSEGGFAPTPGTIPPRRRVPESAPDHSIAFALPNNAALLYRLNGDMNPLHSDPDVAARGGFAQPIMHGMGTFGFATRHIVSIICNHDAGRLSRIGMRFTSPAYPGEGLILDIWESGAFVLRGIDGRKVVDDGVFA